MKTKDGCITIASNSFSLVCLAESMRCIIDNLKAVLICDSLAFFYITDISGLNASQTTKLRRECFNQGVKLCVVKNTLFNHVISASENEEIKSLTSALVGNTAIMYTNVPSAPGKLIKKLLKDGFTKPVVKGAYVQGCAYLGEDKLDQLAAIKTKDELIADIIGLLQSPMRNVLSALQNAAEGKAEDEKIASAPAPVAAEAE